jgi:hypothetical protein
MAIFLASWDVLSAVTTALLPKRKYIPFFNSQHPVNKQELELTA